MASPLEEKRWPTGGMLVDLVIILQTDSYRTLIGAFPDNMQGSPLSLEGTAIKQKFDSVVAEDEMRYCPRCKERWFNVQSQLDGVCKRCHHKKKQDELVGG